jgi:hypothetical protein
VCDVVLVFLASEGQPKAPKQVQVWIGIADGVEIQSFWYGHDNQAAILSKRHLRPPMNAFSAQPQ